MNEAGLRIALHLTARITFAFFVCAFTGNALRDLWPGKFSLWLSRNRDWFLVSMAATHTFHLAAIIAFFQVVGWSKLHLVTLLGGGFVYLLIYSLAATAIMRVRQDGHRFLAGSPKLEAAALYLIWLIFALAFVPRIVSGWPVYSILAVTALAALVIRIACLVRHKRALAAAA
jgi:sulfoxide reductase heme-binding subunit YedZ